MSRRRLEHKGLVWQRYIDKVIKITGDHGRVTGGMKRNYSGLIQAHNERVWKKAIAGYADDTCMCCNSTTLLGLGRNSDDSAAAQGGSVELALG